MRVFKQVEISHNGPIYSLDTHLFTLATGGQDYKVKIWSIEDECNITLKATLSLHQGAVLVVKYNKDGLLASGSDDKSVIIWKNNAVYKILNNHSSDVSDLTFKDDLLATCGFDSKIYIYSHFELIACIDGDGIIKGLQWDPLGEYLAYQSEKSLRIIRARDWKLEKEILIKKSSFFKRFTWSSDGSSIACDSFRGGLNICMIVDRDWDCSTSLVGHTSSIEVLKFHKSVFTQDGNEYSILAMGTQDGCISVWNTRKERAMVVVDQLFSHSVLDLSWSNNTLWACSYDGSVALLKFEDNEMCKGENVDKDRIEQVRNKYSTVKKQIIPMSVGILELEHQYKVKEIVSDTLILPSDPYVNSETCNQDVDMSVDMYTDMSVNLLMATSVNIKKGQSIPEDQIVMNKLQSKIIAGPESKILDETIDVFAEQKVSVTKDGRKRIRPVLVSAPPIDHLLQSNAQTHPKILGDNFKGIDSNYSIASGNTGSASNIKVEYTLPVVVDRPHSNLQVPIMRKLFSVQENDSLLEIKNGMDGASSNALLATMKSDFFAIAYADCTLHLHSRMGSKLMPPLQQDSAISYLYSSTKLIYLTMTGSLKVIDMEFLKFEVECSALPCLVDSFIVSIEYVNNKIIVDTTKDRFVYTGLGWVVLSSHGYSLDKLEVSFGLKQAYFISCVVLEQGVEEAIVAYARKLCDEDVGYRVKELLEIVEGQGLYGGISKTRLKDMVMAIFINNRGLQRVIT